MVRDDTIPIIAPLSGDSQPQGGCIEVAGAWYNREKAVDTQIRLPARQHTAPNPWEAVLLLHTKIPLKGQFYTTLRVREKIVKLIVGLGNPGRAYEKTRHNVGFHVVDLVARAEGWEWRGKRANTLLADGTINNEKVVLARPQTFMNLSGPAVGELVRWYKVGLTDVLVVCDDLDLPFAKIRLRPGGSSGGHHGLESVIQALGTVNFPRLKIGVGRPVVNPMQTAGYILQQPHGKEKELLEEAERLAAETVRCFLREGMQTAMNRFNSLNSAE